MNFDSSGNELVINDLSDSNLVSGFHTIVVTLNDGVNEVVEFIMIDVRDAPVLEEPEPEPEEEEEETDPVQALQSEGSISLVNAEAETSEVLTEQEETD